jgi:hypothetical protein
MVKINIENVYFTKTTKLKILSAKYSLVTLLVSKFSPQQKIKPARKPVYKSKKV